MSDRWITCFVLACLLSFPVFAGEGAADSGEAGLLGSFSAISVEDLDASITWYEENLGFKLESRADSEERSAVLMSRGDALLELAQFSGATSSPVEESYLVYGIFKLGYLVADIDRFFSRLEGNSVVVFFPIVELPSGRRTFAVRDPDGNIVQFFEHWGER